MSHTDVTTTQTEAPQGASDQIAPRLLTAEEAAALARCSTRTVRRAYANGQLIAYRRRGSRAVLLSDEDVLDWAQGQRVGPAVIPISRDFPARIKDRRAARRLIARGLTDPHARVDLSSSGVLTHRSAIAASRAQP